MSELFLSVLEEGVDLLCEDSENLYHRLEPSEQLDLLEKVDDASTEGTYRAKAVTVLEQSGGGRPNLTAEVLQEPEFRTVEESLLILLVVLFIRIEPKALETTPHLINS